MTLLVQKPTGAKLLVQKPTGGKLNITPTAALVDDPDAMTYLAAVEAADGQALEPATRLAVNAFIKGCKADGIWPAIKASCILSGARTLAGALVPLVGSAPTNNNFVSGDYNRKTGLVGNRSNKSLRTGLLASSLGNTSHHFFVHGTSFRTTAAPSACNLGGVYNGSSLSSLVDIIEASITPVLRETRSGTGGNSPTNSATISTGLTASGSISMSRTATNNLRLYQNGVSIASATSSNTPSLPAVAFSVFARNNNGTEGEHTDARLAFYSVGDGLSAPLHTLLDARVTALINAFAAAIP